MSNSLAIAAVTTTLQFLLHQNVKKDLGDLRVTLLPLDKARNDKTDSQLNLFLYMISRNAAWANADMPRQVKPGESSIPPLPLNLYYLVTAFGTDNDAGGPFGHQLLGKAMSVLHDHPVLSADDIRAATSVSLPLNDLDKQVERLRIIPHQLSIDELSKLWTGFGMSYRLSAAYEVAVTLIESTRATRTPLPVIARGPSDRGFPSQADTTPPLPALFSVEPPNRQPSVRLGEVLTLTGVHFDGISVRVRISHPSWAAPVKLIPAGTATALTVQIPNAPKVWPAGLYTVDVIVRRTGETFRRITNQLAFSLAPSIASIAPPNPKAGPIVFTLTVSPEVLPAQRVTLMLGDNEFVADAHAMQTGTLTFTTTGLTAGAYWVRLRVDGADSLLVDRSKTPPVFDTSQSVTVTP